MDNSALYPCFLGPYGENDVLLEKLTVEFLRDHVYWRRNFHPEDPPAIPTHAAQSPEFMAFEARLRRELHRLSAALKRSVPFHSPRYLGHMVSDLLLPGLAAQILTLPYNPNNVSAEAAPVTVELELKVGLQLARMLGYPDDPTRDDCAFGHLTSGGTVANYQALRLALSQKAYPVALHAAGVPWSELAGAGVQGDEQGDVSQALFNLSPARSLACFVAAQNWLATRPAAERAQWRARIQAERIETLGLVGFFARHPTLKPPIVFAPVTAHYSWSKGLKLLGLGRDALRLVPELGMRMDMGALTQMVRDAHAAAQPILLVVGVLGSTEFGTVDPVDALVELRDRSADGGHGFAVHVDGAWGGYLCTVFRQPDGTLRPLDYMRREFERFPSTAVHRAFAALTHTDSVTIDPHKLGYIAYGAGAFVCRDHRAMALLDESADYVFTTRDSRDYFEHYRALGRYVIEGSKPGAMAAAVYVTHQVLPLDHRHFGRLQAQTIRNTEAFRHELERFAAEMHGELKVLQPFDPDSNLVCLALNRSGNTSVPAMNRFVRGLYERMVSNPDAPLQMREFFGSMTTLQPALIGAAQTRELLDRLGLDPATLEPEGGQDDRLVILRHTLMNPYLIDHENGISYLQRYFEFLKRLVRTQALSEH